MKDFPTFMLMAQDISRYFFFSLPFLIEIVLSFGKGYNALVGTLHQQLIHGEAASLDKSHFLWLISYFLRIASQLEVDVKHLS